MNDVSPIGSSFDDYLAEDGVLEQTHAHAIWHLIHDYILQGGRLGYERGHGHFFAADRARARTRSGRWVTLRSAPPGVLESIGGGLLFKSEYRTTGGLTEAYCLDSGEFWWGGHTGRNDREAASVRPVRRIRHD